MPRATTTKTAGTRDRLIAVAIDLFGSKGFDAASTREIAAVAGTNIGSITYHFGSKEGLQEAAGHAIAERMKTVIGAIPLGTVPETPDAALDQLETVLTTMLRFLLMAEQTGPIVAFMLREMAEPSRALERIYEELIEPLHRHVCHLWGAATGADPDSEDTRVAVFTLIGQALYFRIGRAVVSRRLGWHEIGAAEGQVVTARIIANLRSMVAAEREGTR